MIKQFATIIITIALLIAPCSFAETKANGPALAEYKGQTLYKSEVESRLKSNLLLGGSLPDNKRSFDELPQEWKRLIIINAIQQKVLEEHMDKSSITQKPEYKQKLEAIQKNLTVMVFVEETIKKEMTNSLLHKEYAELVKALKASDFLNVSQIALKDEATANKVLQDIKSKTITFEQAAKDYSLDKASAEKGGNVGFVSRGDMPPEIENIAYGLRVGKVSDPIKTPGGCLLIRVDEIKKRPIPEFKDIKLQLEQRVLAKLRDEYMKNLVDDKQIKFMY